MTDALFDCGKCGAKNVEYTHVCKAPTSQPQGELRERVEFLQGQWDACRQRITELEAEVSEAWAEGYKMAEAVEAATIERCASITDKPDFASGLNGILRRDMQSYISGFDDAKRLIKEAIRALATAPQTSALAVKMAEARQQGREDVLSLLSAGLQEDLRVELALAAAKER